MADFKIWMNGKVVPGEQAVLPVNSAAVFYATNCFEGLRAYWNATDGEMYGFRLAEHFARLRESMKMMRFTVPYSDVDLYEAVGEVLKANDVHEDVHMHMVAYVLGTGLDATTPTGLYINPRRRPSVPAGLRACVSSWTRTNDNAIPIRLKSGSNYQNGRLATLQAKADGYDSPILLNQTGTVAEGTGATFFMVRRGVLLTPPLTADILESITRVTLLQDVDRPRRAARRAARRNGAGARDHGGRARLQSRRRRAARCAGSAAARRLANACGVYSPRAWGTTAPATVRRE